MDIPRFPKSLTIYEIADGNALPVAPLKLVLLLKLQAWSQHRASYLSRFLEKVPMDHSDLCYLFTITQRRGTKILPMTQSDSYMSATFVENARNRVREHLTVHPSNKSDWKRLGFDVDALLPLLKSTLTL